MGGVGGWDSPNKRKGLLCSRGTRKDLEWEKCNEGMGKVIEKGRHRPGQEFDYILSARRKAPKGFNNNLT